MPLARVVARTESTTLQLHARRGQFPRTRISTQYKAIMQNTPRILHFVGFIRALKLAIIWNSAKLVPVFESDINVVDVGYDVTRCTLR